MASASHDAKAILDDYLRCTRRSLAERVEPRFYKPTFAFLDPLANFAKLDLTPTLVYSSRRHCEVVTVGDCAFLVHDQYLGQTFNMLNRLLIEQHEPTHAIFYTHKIMAEHFRSRAWPLGAFFCAIFYARHKDELASTGQDLELRNTFTLTQEVFALAHEAYHYALSKDDALRAEIAENIRGYLADRLESSERKLAMTRDEVRTMIVREPLAMHLTNPTKEQIEEAVDEYMSGRDDSYGRVMAAHGIGNDTLQEEMMCDHMASFYTAVALHAHGLERVLEGVYLAHYHLRWLKHLEFELERYHRARVQAAVPVAKSESIPVDLHYVDLQIRSQYMRLRCREVAEECDAIGIAPRNGVDGDRLNQRLLERQRLYYQHLYDPMTNVVGYVLHENGLAAAIDEEFSDEEWPSDLRQRLEDREQASMWLDTIDRLTGWTTTARQNATIQGQLDSLLKRTGLQ